MELIKITEKNGQKLVSARDLHLFLENTDNVNTWFKRQSDRAMLEEGKDFIAIMQESTGGRPSQDFAINIRAAKELAMLNGGDKGKQARMYFIDIEEKSLKPQTPQTYLEALKALVVVEEQKLLLEQKVDNLETALDSLVEWVSIIKVCSFNKIKETNIDWRKLKAKSIEMGYLIKKAQSPRFGFQNLYNVNVFKALYPNYNYSFLNKN